MRNFHSGYGYWDHPDPALARIRGDLHSRPGSDPVLPVIRLDRLRLKHLADHERILASYKELAARGGSAPGPDGVTYEDLGPRNAAEVCRTIGRAIGDRSFVTGPCRVVPIPKPSGGQRFLKLRNILDRTVSKSIAATLQPSFEQLFLPMSYGFRSGIGTFDLLATLAVCMTQTRSWVIACDDIVTAFDRVRLGEVMADLASHIKSKPVLEFIESVIRGGTDTLREVGLEQGDPLSPLLPNTRLHNAHDLPLQEGRVTPLAFQYADNSVYLAPSVSDCQQLHQRSKEFLARAGLTLPGEEGPQDLREGGSVQILGYRLFLKDGQPRLGLGNHAWNNLSAALSEAHETTDPPRLARSVVWGWLEAHGPAIGEAEENEAVDRLLRTTARQASESLAHGTCSGSGPGTRAPGGYPVYG